jgi:hypothetical protein
VADVFRLIQTAAERQLSSAPRSVPDSLRPS